MKVIFLGSASSTHTLRWITNFSKVYPESKIILLTIHSITQNFPNKIEIIKLPFRPPWGYFFNIFFLIKIIKNFKPDILHSFYATGYGFLGRIAFFKKYVISVWGSDILLFPKKSFLHYYIIKMIFNGSYVITSTSKCMIEELNKMNLNKKIFHIPIGIDTFKFNSYRKKNQKFIIGTVKGLDYIYGIDLLIRVFNKFIKKTNIISELHIYGGGYELPKLLKLVNELDINDLVKFKGEVNTSLIPKALNTFDVFVALSRSESFGVSIIEASACNLPVITSDALGFQETVLNGKTGFVFNLDNLDDIVDKLIELASNENLRKIIGQHGKYFVESLYSKKVMKSNIYNFYNEII